MRRIGFQKSNNRLKLVRDSIRTIKQTPRRGVIKGKGAVQAAILSKKVRESKFPVPVKWVLKRGLSNVIHANLTRGKMWRSFMEDVEFMERKRGKSFTKKELIQKWHEWNDAHSNC